MNAGGVTPDESTYPGNIAMSHAAMLNGIAPTNYANYDAAYWGQLPLDVNVTDAMFDASSMGGGSPYAMVESYDPDDDLAVVDTQYEKFSDAVDDLVPSTDMEAAIVAAISLYDVKIGDSGQEITDLMTASEARSRPEHLRAKSRVASGFQDIRAVMTTQFSMAMAGMEHDRANRLADIEEKLLLFGARERTQAILNMTDGYLGQIQRKLAAQQSATTMRQDMMRIKVATKQDQIESDLEYETQDALWDLNLFAFHGNVLASINGATSMPRSQTRRERNAAALYTSTSQALQVGGVTESYGWGLAAFGLSFASQMRAIP